MNNDRFKFRVFSKFKEHYVPSDNLVITNDGELVEPYYMLDGDIYFSRPTENLIVEQCTGLKDANGKLIYEGDILQTPSNTYFVRHDEKTCGFICEYHIDGRMGLLLHSDLAFKKYRIVGNIHENPELLEGKQ